MEWKKFGKLVVIVLFSFNNWRSSIVCAISGVGLCFPRDFGDDNNDRGARYMTGIVGVPLSEPDDWELLTTTSVRWVQSFWGLATRICLLLWSGFCSVWITVDYRIEFGKDCFRFAMERG